MLTFVDVATEITNEHLLQSYIEKAHKYDIEPKLKNKYNNNVTLNRLMDMQSDLKYHKKDQKLVKTLLLLTFGSIDDTPNLERVRKELISNPSV